MVQQILVIILFFVAVGFLFKKFFWKGKSKKACGSDGIDCGCH